jgi:iron complex transport system permease protein
MTYALWIAGALAVGAASLFVGAAQLNDASLAGTVLSLRMTRALAAALAGAALAVGGVLVQGLFRNPLASPEIVGATAGATFGGHATLLLFEVLLGSSVAAWIAPGMFVPLGCVTGALVAIMTVLWVLRRRDDVIVVLVIGFLLGAMFLALDGVITSLAQERWELARAMLAITLGDVSMASPRQITLALPLVASGIVAACLWARPLDVLLSGEEEAATLGLHVPTVRRWVVIWVALLTAGAVSVGGNVGFVGLVVPHVLRRYLGVGHRALMPMAAIVGAAFLMGCDMLVRVIPSRSELPLGVVTALIGAPVFFTLLMKVDLRGQHD